MPRCEVRRRSLAWSLVAILGLGIAILGAASARAETVPTQDAMDMTDAPAAPEAAPWNAFGVSSSRSAARGEASTMRVDLNPGDHAFLRTSELSPAPGAVMITFNLSIAGAGGKTPMAQVFRIGSGFGASNRDESDAATYARFGLNLTGAGFQLRDLIGRRNGPVFDGTQAITWALNNSGHALSYSAPDGTEEALANDRMDVWVGRTKVFDDAATTTPGGSLANLKWYWGAGAGSTALDRFAIRSLAAAATVESSPAPMAATVEASASEETVELYRPRPNPFERTMRYAYAISSGVDLVDIGVFDVAGRRIRSLVRGSQTAGQYEVVWNGLGDDGTRIKAGIYFLRASVGSQNRVARVVYLVK